MENKINLSVTHEAGRAIIDIAGDITSITGKKIIEAYETSSAEGATAFVLRFTVDCYINSGGLIYLMDIANESKKKKQDVCVSGLSDHFMKIFKMVGLTRCFDMSQGATNTIKKL